MIWISSHKAILEIAGAGVRRRAGRGPTAGHERHRARPAQRLGLTWFASPSVAEFDDTSWLTPVQLAHAREGYEILAGYVRHMHDAGVRLTIGTDWIDPGRAVLSEMLLLHDVGIPMAEVFRIATLDGARAIGVADEAGAVDPGMRAHLVVFDSDPLLDPRAILGGKTVIKDGVVVSRGS